ncbi:MAG: hypothetical protein LBE24_02085 [Methylobacillus sp.]|jgi:hypothetical protein|nr:hypothetical protein [Methylobacillus sp.]
MHEADSALVSRISAWLALDRASGGMMETCPAERNALDLEVELFHPDWEEPSADKLTQLDRLRKKIEVVRKLYRFYLPDLARAITTTELSAAAVRHLCALLLKAALVQNDARYLNSALKLLDGVLARDDCNFPNELHIFAHATLDVLVPPVSGTA